MTVPAEKSAGQVFVISRTFDAPRKRVWQAWTEPERMMHWWGPKGTAMLDCKIDLRPEGVLHYRIRYGGQDMWGKFVYREIAKPDFDHWHILNKISGEYLIQ